MVSKGMRWSTEDHNKMLELSENGKTVEDIAKELKRTAGGVYVRIMNHAVKCIKKENTDIEVVATKYHLNLEKLSESVDIGEKTKIKKNTTKNTYVDVDNLRQMLEKFKTSKEISNEELDKHIQTIIKIQEKLVNELIK
jgi:hypothetical protein